MNGLLGGMVYGDLLHTNADAERVMNVVTWSEATLRKRAARLGYSQLKSKIGT